MPKNWLSIDEAVEIINNDDRKSLLNLIFRLSRLSDDFCNSAAIPWWTSEDEQEKVITLRNKCREVISEAYDVCAENIDASHEINLIKKNE